MPTLAQSSQTETGGAGLARLAPTLLVTHFVRSFAACATSK
jgi:hypothetical protein